MQSITLTPNERKDLMIEMKRERKPSRRLRMHIVLLEPQKTLIVLPRLLVFFSAPVPPSMRSSVAAFGKDKKLSMSANGEVLRRWSTTRRRG